MHIIFDKIEDSVPIDQLSISTLEQMQFDNDEDGNGELFHRKKYDDQN